MRFAAPDKTSTLGRSSRGATLLELIVASSLVGLMMIQVWALIVYGNRFYFKVRSQSETQRTLLLALRWLSSDLSEGAAFSFRQFNPPDAPYSGVSFGSPKDSDGQVSYDGSGRILWASVLCYYIDHNDNGTLYRTQRLLATPDISPPVITNSVHGTGPMSSQSPKRVIARDIFSLQSVQQTENVQIFLHARHQELGYGLRVQTTIAMKNK